MDKNAKKIFDVFFTDELNSIIEKQKGKENISEELKDYYKKSKSYLLSEFDNKKNLIINLFDYSLINDNALSLLGTVVENTKVNSESFISYYQKLTQGTANTVEVALKMILTKIQEDNDIINKNISEFSTHLSIVTYAAIQAQKAMLMGKMLGADVSEDDVSAKSLVVPIRKYLEILSDYAEF